MAMTMRDDTGTPKALVRESERRFRMALANSPIVVFEQDLDLRYTWIHNPKLGYKVSEVIGKTDEEVMDSAFAARLTQIKRAVIDEGKAARAEIATAAPGGPIEYYDLSVEPLRDEAGAIIGVICAATEITERKQAEHALRAGEALSWSVFESSPDCVKILSLDGRLERMNGNGRRLMEIDDFEAVRGRFWPDLWPPEARAGLRAAMDEARADRPARFSGFCPTAKGAPKWWDVSITAIPDADGSPARLIASSRDVTDARKAEQALQVSDHRFRLAMELSATSCFSLDRDLRFTWLYATQVGFGGEDPVGKTEYAHFTEETADRLTRLYRQVLDAGERRRQDIRVQSLFKSAPQDFEIVVEPLRGAGGEKTGIIAAATDITERKRAEELLRVSEQRNSFLLGLSDRIKSLDDPLEIMAAAGEWLGKSIGADQVVCAEIDADQEFAKISHEWSAGPTPGNIGAYRLVDFGADFIADLKAGKIVVIDDIAVDPRTCSESAQASFRACSVGAIMSVPLVRRDQIVVGMSVHSRKARRWSPLDVSLAEETAERAWDSIERARSAQQALASGAMLEAALSAMTDAVYISDVEGRFIHINDAFAAFFKFGSKAECFTTFAEYPALVEAFTPDGAPTPIEQRAVPRALRGETAVGEEYTLRRTDTGETWLASYCYAPIRNGDGAIVGAVVTVRDITAQRRAEVDLRDHQRRLKAIFETSMEGIITIDSKGIIQAANSAAADIYGYGINEMLGCNINMLIPEARRTRHDSLVAKYLLASDRTVIGRRRKIEGLRKNGEIFPSEITVTDASDNRDVLFIGFMRDLTQIENEKRRTEDAQAELLHVARLSDMGEVAAGLAHEVSQPLTVIRTLASVGRRALSSTTEPSIAHVIEVIDTEAKNAADLLKRLRGFIEKRESKRHPESLEKLIEDALALASARSNGRPVRIVSKRSSEEFVVNVDRVQILQVLLNFLRNASDAMADHPDPEVVIETGIEKPGIMRVCVSDNGPGVDPKIADRLFTPFVTTKSFGMGVGLSLCKTIIESHDGEIGCAANLPKGATFWFTLPLDQSSKAADDGASTASGAA